MPFISFRYCSMESVENAALRLMSARPHEGRRSGFEVPPKS